MLRQNSYLTETRETCKTWRRVGEVEVAGVRTENVEVEV
jgi:hypothetical protein